MNFQMKITFIYGIILTIIHLTTSQGSRLCNTLEERLNLNDEEKLQLNLNREYTSCSNLFLKKSLLKWVKFLLQRALQ